MSVDHDPVCAPLMTMPRPALGPAQLTPCSSRTNAMAACAELAAAEANG